MYVVEDVSGYKNIFCNPKVLAPTKIIVWLFPWERFCSNHHFLDTVDDTQKLKIQRRRENVLVFHIVI